MRIGIYGGSFNPIHLGHTRLAAWLVDNGYVDAVWLMVSPQNPLKKAEGLMDDELRLRLARIALPESLSGEGRGVSVSDFEFHLPRPSYTADTLAALREAYPEHEFVLVIGADNWLRFPRWVRPDEIMQHHDIIVYPRPGYEVDATTLPPRVQLVNTPLYPISSTWIRNEIATNPNYDGEGLAAEVWKEIKTLPNLPLRGGL